jgi:hypothetical protein
MTRPGTTRNLRSSSPAEPEYEFCCAFCGRPFVDPQKLEEHEQGCDEIDLEARDDD